MSSKIRLLSTDFDGTLVAHDTDPVLDTRCMQTIRELQDGGAIWAINTGRSVQLLNRKTNHMEKFMEVGLPASIMSRFEHRRDQDKYPELLRFRAWIETGPSTSIARCA